MITFFLKIHFQQTFNIQLAEFRDFFCMARLSTALNH